jgi:hypothetical protein
MFWSIEAGSKPQRTEDFALITRLSTEFLENEVFYSTNQISTVGHRLQNTFAHAGFKSRGIVQNPQDTEGTEDDG